MLSDIIFELELLWIPFEPLLVIVFPNMVLLNKLEVIIPEIPFPLIVFPLIVQLLAFKWIFPFIVKP